MTQACSGFGLAHQENLSGGKYSKRELGRVGVVVVVVVLVGGWLLVLVLIGGRVEAALGGGSCTCCFLSPQPGQQRAGGGGTECDSSQLDSSLISNRSKLSQLNSTSLPGKTTWSASRGCRCGVTCVSDKLQCRDCRATARWRALLE